MLQDVALEVQYSLVILKPCNRSQSKANMQVYNKDTIFYYSALKPKIQYRRIIMPLVFLKSEKGERNLRALPLLIVRIADPKDNVQFNAAG